jgi:GNAT superfamily N-acetyltransferase
VNSERVFRLATRNDVPQLDGLIETSARVLCAGHYDDRQIERALGPVFGVDLQLIDDGTFYVAADGDRLVGCGGWSKRKSLYGGSAGRAEPDPLLDPATDPALIRAYFVHPDAARQGIGRRLLELCEHAARTDGFTRLNLGATLPGEPLYAALGFEVTERAEIDLGDGITLPFARMTKSI